MVEIRDKQSTVKIALKLGIDLDDLCKRTNIIGWGEAATNPSGVEIRLR